MIKKEANELTTEKNILNAGKLIIWNLNNLKHQFNLNYI